MQIDGHSMHRVDDAISAFYHAWKDGRTLMQRSPEVLVEGAVARMFAVQLHASVKCFRVLIRNGTYFVFICIMNTNPPLDNVDIEGLCIRFAGLVERVSDRLVIVWLSVLFIGGRYVERVYHWADLLCTG